MMTTPSSASPRRRPAGDELTSDFKVVVVDDRSSALLLLSKLAASLSEEVSVTAFSDPLEALSHLKSCGADMVLTDHSMPGIDGTTLTQAIRGIPHMGDVPLVVVTSAADKNTRYGALEAGASDFITHPVDLKEAQARCRNLLALRGQQRQLAHHARSLEEEVRAATIEIRRREHDTLRMLAKAGEFRDEDTGLHLVRMSKYTRILAVALGLSRQDCRVLEYAAPLHDIGKIGIPDSILLKPGKLTPDEWAVMKTHSELGAALLSGGRPSMYLKAGAVIAAGHHEKFDGSGYPRGLAGEDIPLPARIVAVADVFDALTSERPYKKAWPLKDAFDFIRDQSGRHFDPRCVEAFEAAKSDVTRIALAMADNRSTK